MGINQQASTLASAAAGRRSCACRPAVSIAQATPREGAAVYRFDPNGTAPGRHQVKHQIHAFKAA